MFTLSDALPVQRAPGDPLIPTKKVSRLFSVDPWKHFS